MPKTNHYKRLGSVLAPWHRWPWFWYALTASVLSVLVVTLAALALVQEKHRYQERSAEATRSIARLLDQQVSNVFDKVDLVLLNVRQIYLDQTTGRLDAAALNAVLQREEALLPEISSLRIADAKGAIRFGSELPQEVFVAIGDREYFQQVRDHPQAGMIVSGPLMSRISRKWVVVLARRLETADGQFAGVVYANLSCDYFEKVFRVTALGKEGAATIRMENMALVYRYPDSRNATGSRSISRQLEKMVALSPLAGEYVAVTSLDGVERSNAYRRVANYPMYVIVGQATREFLEGWRESMMMTLALAAMLLGVTWLATLWVVRGQMRLREDIAQRIRIGKALELAIEERGELLTELASKNETLAQANQTLEQKVAERTAELLQVNQNLEALARRDALTQLYNRRSIDERLRDEFLRMKRTGISYALLLIDLDHFKEVNDRFGHEKGDQVLRQLAGTMYTTCRGTDFIGRFGGEEFLVILPGTLADRAMFVAEKIRLAVADDPVSGVGQITVSIGVACATAEEGDEMEALRRADRALYRAKGGGRNQIIGDPVTMTSVV